MVHEHKMHTLRFSTRHHAPVHLRPPTSQTHVETKTLDPKDDEGPPRSPHLGTLNSRGHGSLPASLLPRTETVQGSHSPTSACSGILVLRP